MNPAPPLACSLNAQELPLRLEEMRRLGEAALLSVAPDGGLRFRGDEATRRRLGAVIAAESRCCPFLSFDLREQAGALMLTIGAPDGAESLARDLIEAFAGPERLALAVSSTGGDRPGDDRG